MGVYIYMSALCARTKPPPQNVEGFVRLPCAGACAVSILFQCCFNTVSILFQYCFNTISMLFLTISDYLQPAAYRLQAAACRLQATPWALKGPEYAKTYHFLMILATPTP